MIANYGYQDGSGFYYITVDTDRCVECSTHDCETACPQHVLVVEMDDYDDVVAAVAEPARRRLRELCAACKCAAERQDVAAVDGGGPAADGVTPARSERVAPRSRDLPCREACRAGAITHSW